MEDAQIIITCLACNATMIGDAEQICAKCGSEHLISLDAIDPRDWTAKQKALIVQQDNEAREERARKQKAEQQAAHPVDADGELDMSCPENNELIPQDKPEQYDKNDMADGRNNPLLPDSRAKVDFGEPEVELDMSQPENNPLIPSA